MQSPIDDQLVVFTGKFTSTSAAIVFLPNHYFLPLTNKLTIFLDLGTNGINWVTEDCGANLRALNSGKRIHEFHFHPNQRSWALAAGWTSCADFADDEPCEIYKELYITKDLGNSW